MGCSALIASAAVSGYADASPFLQELVEKSLLKYSVEADGTARFSMLETMQGQALLIKGVAAYPLE